MIDVLAKHWWAVVLRGVVAVLFGLAAIFLPGITLTALVILFGAYALVDGIFGIISGVRAFEHRHNWWPLIEGVISFLVGLVALLFPGAAALGFLYVIGTWAFVTGLLEIFQAVRLRDEIDNEWMLALAGVLSVIFGIFVVIIPVAAAVAILWIIGGYGIIFGIVLIALGFRLRGMRSEQVAG